MIRVRFEQLWYGPTHIGEKATAKAVNKATGKAVLETMGRRYRAYTPEHPHEYVFTDDFLAILPKTAQVFEIEPEEARRTLNAEELRIKRGQAAREEATASNPQDFVDITEIAGQQQEAKAKAEAFQEQLRKEAEAAEAADKQQANKDRMAKVRAARGSKSKRAAAGRRKK